MGIKELISKPVSTIIVLLLVLAVGFAGGFFARGFEVRTLTAANAKLTAQILTIQAQSEIEIDTIKKEAEIEKLKAKIEIENLPADAVVIRFLTDDEITGRTDYVDGIAKQIIDHSLQFFREMGIHFATTDNRDVERRIQGGDTEDTARIDGL